MRTPGLVVVVAAFLLSMPAAATAQDPAQGRQAWITTVDGRLHHGTVTRVTAEAITLTSAAGTETLTKTAIRRIEVRDSLHNGIMTGAITTAIVGGAGAAYLVQATCESDTCTGTTLGSAILGGLMGVIAGGLGGAAIDALIPGREVIFERAAVELVPVVGSRRRGVALHVRW